MVLDCIDSWSLQPYYISDRYLTSIKYTRILTCLTRIIWPGKFCITRVELFSTVHKREGFLWTPILVKQTKIPQTFIEHKVIFPHKSGNTLNSLLFKFIIMLILESIWNVRLGFHCTNVCKGKSYGYQQVCNFEHYNFVAEKMEFFTNKHDPRFEYLQHYFAPFGGGWGCMSHYLHEILIILPHLHVYWGTLETHHYTFTDFFFTILIQMCILYHFLSPYKMLLICHNFDLLMLFILA